MLLGFVHVPAPRPLLAVLFLAAFLLALLTALDPALRAPMYFLRPPALVEICFSLT